MFFDAAWELGKFDTSKHEYAEDYDSLVKNWAVIWRLAKDSGEGRSSHAREADSTGADSSPERSAESPTIELDDANDARQATLSEYLHKTAALERDVMSFREEFLGGPDRTLSRLEALHRLEEAEIPQGQTPTMSTVLVTMPEGEFGRDFRVAEKSSWGRLSTLAVTLSRKYPWDEAQAAAFVLSGDSYSDDGRTTAFTPPIARIGTRRGLSKGHAAHPYNRTVIMMEVASWVPWKKVMRAFIEKQRELNGGKAPRKPSLRCVEVFRFVLRNCTVKTVDRKEHLARLEHPTWRSLRERWDDVYASEHTWHYGEDNFRNFQRDFELGQAAVLGVPKGGLLGIPGEPRTPAQHIEHLKKRFAEASRQRSTSN